MKEISQREARRTRRELFELQNKHAAMQRRYVSNYPGTCIRTGIAISDASRDALNVAALLGFGLAAKVDGDKLEIYAVKG